MADLFPPFSPSPGALVAITSGSPSAENSPPTALTRSSPSPHLKREQRKALRPLADGSDDDGYSPHPSIYEASPVASDDEGRDDKEKIYDSYDSLKQKSPELPNSEQPCSLGSAGGGRNFSRFSGLSMMETITEQKSIASISGEMLDGGAYSPIGQDEESEDSGDEQYYYDYASPTQPLHPAMSTSAPNLGGPSYPSSSEHPESAPTASTFFSRGLSSSPRSFPSHQPTFRPVLSMNRSYGTLSSHPFHRAPVLVTVPNTENQRTPDLLESPINRSQPGSLRDIGVWGRLCRGFCLVCCCVSLSDDDHP